MTFRIKTFSLLLVSLTAGIGVFAQQDTVRKRLRGPHNPPAERISREELIRSQQELMKLDYFNIKDSANIKKDSTFRDSIVRDPAIMDSVYARLYQENETIDLGSLHFSDPEVNKGRVWLVAGGNIVGYGGSLVLLGSTWYQNESRTSFHLFNDSREWLQVDKIGHGWAAYNAGRATAGMWKWAGLSHKKATWFGGLSSFAYLTGIEFLDAHSTKWGWSWSDMAANVIGSGLFISQELAWKEQRIQYKFSFHGNKYKDPQLEERADDLFGKPWYERMLKDYNAQTYWFSFNLRSFFRKSNLPAWLNVAAGYGADGMFGGFENKWMDELGNDIVRNDIPRKRQFYLSPDIDFTKIKTKSRFLKTAFFVLNSFKCPAPALMLDSKGKMRAFLFYF